MADGGAGSGRAGGGAASGRADDGAAGGTADDVAAGGTAEGGAAGGTPRGPRGQEDPVDVLRRWEQRGAGWRVVGRGREGLTVALLTCDGGEEVDRLVSADPSLADHLAGRESSEDAAPR